MAFFSLKFETPWRKWRVYWLALLPGLYLLYMAGMYFFQDRVVFPGAGKPTMLPTEFGMSVEDVTLDTPDGARLAAWFIPGARDSHPAGAAGKQPCAIWFEGNAENRGDRLPQIKYWHRLGIAVFIFDYRGYGDSTGSVTCRNARADAKLVLDWVLQRPEVDPARIILDGHSIGSGVCGTLLPDFHPAAIVLEAPFATLVDAARDNTRLLPVAWLLRENYDTEAKLRAYDGPVLIMASRKDELFHPEHAHRLNRANGRSTLVWDDAAHADQRQGAMYGDTIEAFLAEAGLIAVTGELAAPLVAPPAANAKPAP